MENCKVCGTCGIEKSTIEFYKNSTRKDGLARDCKFCVSIYSKKWREKNHDHKNNYERKRRQVRGDNRDQFLAKKRKYNKDSYHVIKNAKLKKLYGITLETYNKMKNEQEGRCAICFTKAKLFVDHSHKTSLIRGLLCNKCNTGLGMFGDSSTILEAASKYLRERDLHL